MRRVKLPSDRSFGFLFVCVLSGVGGYGLYKGWSYVPVAVAFVASFALMLVTLLSPRILAPLNKVWFQLGYLLGKIVSPIVLGIIFYLLLTPIALITRTLGRDELKLKRRSVESYWVERTPPGPDAGSFKNQF